MQSKKRAKPVKFGNKNKSEHRTAQSKEAEKMKQVTQESNDELVDEKKGEIQEETSEKEHGAHGLEAHISRTTETIDIKEISDDSEKENISEEKSSDIDKKEVEIVEASANDQSTDVKAESKNEDVVSSDELSEPAFPEATETAEAEESDQEGEEEDGDESDTTEEENTEDSPVNKDGAFFNRPPDEYEQKKSTVPYFIMIVVITFIIGVVFFSGIYYAVQNKSIKLPGSKNAEVTEAPVIEVPTKKPVDLSQYTIQVLNGTGTAGVAAKVKDQLSTAGFKVGSVGNAENDEFEKTEISAAKKVDKEYLNKLKEKLEESYVVDEVTKLSSGSADVVVTIGSETAE